MLFIGSLIGALLITAVSVVNYADAGGNLLIDPAWLLVQVVGLTGLLWAIGTAIRSLANAPADGGSTRDDRTVS